MKHIAAYALLVLGGNETPSAKDVTELLDSVGAEADKESLKTLLASLKDKSIHELISAGREKLEKAPGGAVAVAATGAADAGAAEVKEEKKKEESEEAEADMGGLFGDDEDY
mmetsp:Transcript_45863/g.52891  ORF Transcript_45863/g.52891 Transcript_45863/m.52891 type:complete len:112 (+) Transcript_45863:117-452(+)